MIYLYHKVPDGMAGDTHTSEEQYKFDVITKVIKKEIKPGLAAKLLSISTRQIRRLKISVRKYGVSATAHKLKGKPGNHHIDLMVKEKALTAIKAAYSDFKPTFATEKLKEITEDEDYISYQLKPRHIELK